MTTTDPVLAAHIAARDAAFLAAHGATNPAAVAYLEETARDLIARQAAHRATMGVPPDLAMWALAMAAKHDTAYCRVHALVQDWLGALLVILHGEEPDATRTWDGHGWPEAFGPRERDRAAQLLAGHNVPTYVTPLHPEG